MANFMYLRAGNRSTGLPFLPVYPWDWNKVMPSRTMVVLATVLLTWAAWLGTAQAEPISFKVPLSGGQEVPPVFPAGTGTADLTYDSATRVLTWMTTAICWSIS